MRGGGPRVGGRGLVRTLLIHQGGSREANRMRSCRGGGQGLKRPGREGSPLCVLKSLEDKTREK